MKKTILSMTLAFAFLAGAGDVSAYSVAPHNKLSGKDETKAAVAAYAQNSLDVEADFKGLDDKFKAIKKSTSGKIKEFAEWGHDISEAIHKPHGMKYITKMNEELGKDILNISGAFSADAKNLAQEIVDTVSKYRNAACSGANFTEINKSLDLILQAFAQLGVTPTVAAPVTTTPVATPQPTATTGMSSFRVF